jgi:hypothetical protein
MMSVIVAAVLKITVGACERKKQPQLPRGAPAAQKYDKSSSTRVTRVYIME